MYMAQCDTTRKGGRALHGTRKRPHWFRLRLPYDDPDASPCSSRSPSPFKLPQTPGAASGAGSAAAGNGNGDSARRLTVRVIEARDLGAGAAGGTVQFVATVAGAKRRTSRRKPAAAPGTAWMGPPGAKAPGTRARSSIGTTS